MIYRLLLSMGVLLVIGFGTSQSFASKPINAINSNDDGVAIHGYDTVAYFTKEEPVKGRKKYSYKWRGAKWYFSSRKHKKLFIKNPTKYAPQYGGYCAYAVSYGGTADVDPFSWKIYDGKLYLNVNRNIFNKWNMDVDGYIERADEKWPNISKYSEEDDDGEE